MISSRRPSLFIIGSHSLVGDLYYLASDLPGLRPPGLQTRKTMRSRGWEGGAPASAEGPQLPRAARALTPLGFHGK